MNKTEQEGPAMADSKSQAKKKKQPFWLVYIALLIAGAILLADAFSIADLNRWTGKLGIGMIWTALALFVSGQRLAGIIAVVIVWLAVLATFLF